MREKLINICNPKQWKTLSTSELIENGLYDVYGANGIIGKYNVYNHEESVVTITCRGATCGNVHITSPKAYVNGNAMCLDNLNENICLKKYLYYYLQNYNMKKVISGSAQPQITVRGLSKIEIKLYDIDTQKVIINRLEKLEGLIGIRKKQIKYLDNLIKSQFVEMFGTDKTSKYTFDSLNNLTLKITDGKHGGCNGEDNSGYYFVGATEIYNDKINYQTAKEITKNDFEKDYKRCDLRNNDFVIVNTGATIGKSAIVNSNLTDHTLLQKSVALIRTKDDILNPLYLKYCYEANPDLYNKGNGCARLNLLLSQIKGTMIPVPPIELQNKFAKIVEQIDKQKVEIQKSLEEMQQLQKSLMSNYF